MLWQSLLPCEVFTGQFYDTRSSKMYYAIFFFFLIFPYFSKNYLEDRKRRGDKRFRKKANSRGKVENPVTIESRP